MTRGGGSAEWRAAAVHAALLFGATTFAVPGLASFAAPVFAPPTDSPLILSRKVVRELRDGAEIVATRRYRVTFRRMGDGWDVDGALIASEIDAPSALAALAALERDRPDDGLFPIHLDRVGRIVPDQPAQGLGRQAVAGALGAARHRSDVGDTNAAGGFIAQLGAIAASPSGGLAPWPEALFLPHGLNGTSEQAFKLPDGSDGSVRVVLESEAAPASATMGRARRTVVTLADGTRRVAREEWTLGPISATAKP